MWCGLAALVSTRRILTGIYQRSSIIYNFY